MTAISTVFADDSQGTHQLNDNLKSISKDSGWVNNQANMYYYSNGDMVYGEQKINNGWYYFDQITGAMVVGFKNLDNKTVYYNDQGKMVYGEQKINNSWYYFDQTTGAMVTGNSDEQKLVNLLNQKRKSLGLQPVILDTALSARAKARAANAVANGGLPDNHMNTNGEVVGIGWSINQMIDAWYNETNMITNGTPGHRMWVANPRATKVGFGLVGNTIVGISDIGQY